MKEIIVMEMTRLPFGHLKCNLNRILEENHISMNKLSNMTGVSYKTVHRYCQPNIRLHKIDADFMSMIIRITGCSIGDLLEYVPPEE